MMAHSGESMVWLGRVGWAAVGALATLAIGFVFGRVEFGGDFVANIAGASIGGGISVGLAIAMFSHQRDVARKDTAKAEARTWAAAIRESLRYIRAIREAVDAGRGITINNGDQLSNAMAQSADLTVRALSDVNLTDFRLRLAMEEAAKIGHQVSQTLPAQLAQAGLTDANTPLMAAANTCDPAIVKLDELIAEYTRIRNLPSI